MLRAPPPQYGPGFWIASIERRQLDHAFQKTVFCVPNIYGNPNHQPIDIGVWNYAPASRRQSASPRLSEPRVGPSDRESTAEHISQKSVRDRLGCRSVGHEKQHHKPSPSDPRHRCDGHSCSARARSRPGPGVSQAFCPARELYLGSTRRRVNPSAAGRGAGRELLVRR